MTWSSTTLFPSSAARRGAAALAAIALIGLGCAFDTAKPAAPPPSSLQPAPLECNSAESEWRDAFIRAKSERTLDPLTAEVAALQRQCPSRWEPLWLEGELSLLKGDGASARGAFARGFVQAEAADDGPGRAILANALGRALRREAYDLGGAEARYRESIAIATELRRDDLRAQALNNLAGIFVFTGRIAEAAATQREVVAALEATADPGLDTARYNFANLLLELGDGESARPMLEALQRTGDPAPLRAKAAMRLATIDALAERWDVARALFDGAREADPQQAGRIDLHQGILELEFGDVAGARDQLDRAQRTTMDRFDALGARVWRAHADALLGRTAIAESDLRQVMREVDALGTKEAAWRSRLFLGQLLALSGRPREAIPLLQRAVEIVRVQRAPLGPDALGLRFLSRRNDPFVELSAALGAVERADSTNRMLALHRQAHGYALQALDAGERAAPLLTSEQIAAQRFELQPGELLIDVLIGSETSSVIATTRDAARVLRAPGLRALRPLIRGYRRALQRPLHSAAARLAGLADFERGKLDGEALYRALLAPLESLLARAERVYFVLDGELALVPPATLPIPPESSLRVKGSFLGECMETALMPFAGAPPRWQGRVVRVLLAGDPIVSAHDELPPLPAAASELRRLGTVWGAAAVHLEREALNAQQLAASTIARFDLLHFATHAIASGRDPQRCALVFSRGERWGFDRIAATRLDDPLVVLSACRTGEGEVIPGEGIVGLSWAFLRAGARGVVLSSWSVDDLATAELMHSLHRALAAGRDPISALSLARREARAKAGHPAYWGAFEVLVRP